LRLPPKISRTTEAFGIENAISYSSPYSFSNSFSFYNPGKAFLLLLLPDKRRKKIRKAPNQNKTKPNKTNLAGLDPK